MTSKEIDRLLAIARAATPGEWSNALDVVPEGYALTANGRDSLLSLDNDDMAIFDKPADAAHCAAFSLAVAIPLLEQLGVALKRIDYLENCFIWKTLPQPPPLPAPPPKPFDVTRWHPGQPDRVGLWWLQYPNSNHRFVYSVQEFEFEHPSYGFSAGTRCAYIGPVPELPREG